MELGQTDRLRCREKKVQSYIPFLRQADDVNTCCGCFCHMEMEIVSNSPQLFSDLHVNHQLVRLLVHRCCCRSTAFTEIELLNPFSHVPGWGWRLSALVLSLGHTVQWILFKQFLYKLGYPAWTGFAIYILPFFHLLKIFSLSYYVFDELENFPSLDTEREQQQTDEKKKKKKIRFTLIISSEFMRRLQSIFSKMSKWTQADWTKGTEFK